MCFCLCWAFVSEWPFSLVVASEGHSGYSAWASHCRGFSCCGACALGCTGLVAPQHVGSSQMRDPTHVSYTGMRVLYC